MSSGSIITGEAKFDFPKKADRFSMDTAVTNLGKNLKASEATLQDAMKELQSQNNPDPASLAEMQFRINKWTLNFNMFSSMIKSVKDVSTAIIQKV